MRFKIMGRYAGETEEIDEAGTAREARYLLGEYQMAFGGGWSLWCPQLGGGSDA